MQLASLVHQYLGPFQAQYAAQLLPGHLKAIGAIRRCRTPDSGNCQGTCRLGELTHAALSIVFRVSFRSVLLGFR